MYGVYSLLLSMNLTGVFVAIRAMSAQRYSPLMHSKPILMQEPILLRTQSGYCAVLSLNAQSVKHGQNNARVNVNLSQDPPLPSMCCIMADATVGRSWR